MIRRHLMAFQVGLLVADALSAVALFAVISRLRLGDEWPDVWRRVGVDPIGLAVIWALVWVVTLALQDLYRTRSRWSIRSEARALAQASLMLAVASFSALFLFKLPDVSRLFLLSLFASQTLLTFASRLAMRWTLRTLRDNGYYTRYLLVIGTGPEAESFADRIERHRELGLRVIGHIGLEGESAERVGDRPVLATVERLEEVLHGRVVDEVAICLPAQNTAMIEPIARVCEEVGKVVRIPVDERRISLPGGRLEAFDGMPILSLVYGPDRAVALVVKRLLDVVLATVALLVLSPIFLLIAVCVVALDGRPVFFRQDRVGLQGRRFRVVKFRTMVPDAEDRLADLAGLNEIKGHAFKLTDDPRLSRTGWFLRATSLDELPQLWNVLRGEMSLVGPRPPLPTEVAGYDLWHRRRLSMKPGITGLWQVEARRDEDFDRWVELDLAYIDRWSVWLDLKIMARTIPAMLQGR